MEKYYKTKLGFVVKLANRENRDKKYKWAVRYEPISFLGNMLAFYLGYYIVVFYKHKMNTPKQWWRIKKYDFRRWSDRTEKKVEHWYRYNFENKPIYYSVTSMDCDLCESTSFGKHKNYREYYDWLTDADAWDWVEGRTSVDLHSKEDWEYYNEQPRRTRDYIMEAYEDGRGRNVII